MNSDIDKSDLEKKEQKIASFDNGCPSSGQSVNEVEPNPIKRSKWFSWAYKLDALGVETRGIERILPEERAIMNDKKKHSKLRLFISVIGLWVSACGGLTSMSSFFLPSLQYDLNLRDSLVSGLISMCLGCVIPAFCSTMGPKSGCRQMVTARFLFGWWAVRIVALIVIISGLGWSVINCVVGGEVLAAFSNVSLAVGIVIISIISLVIAVFGIKIVLYFQNILAIPLIIISIMFYVVVCKRYSYIHETNTAIAEKNIDANTIRGNWLSFFTIGYSVTATWGSGASDYYILFPEETPWWQTFCVTFFATSLPTAFVGIISVICGAIAYSYQPWGSAYDKGGVGGLIFEAAKPWGNWGKLIVVFYYISLICNNIMNTYSCAFEFQLIDYRLSIIPRWCWAILVTVIYLVVSLAGREHLSEILSNFLPMLGYWTSIYITLLIEENLLFRFFSTFRRLHYREFGLDKECQDLVCDKRQLYNWEGYNNPRVITFGFASIIAFLAGVAGAVVGMNQVYWQGPIARKIGNYGGDIGFFLCIAFTCVSYPGLRYVELKLCGK